MLVGRTISRIEIYCSTYYSISLYILYYAQISSRIKVYRTIFDYIIERATVENKKKISIINVIKNRPIYLDDYLVNILLDNASVV